jgi:hypothetical protein
MMTPVAAQPWRSHFYNVQFREDFNGRPRLIRHQQDGQSFLVTHPYYAGLNGTIWDTAAAHLAGLLAAASGGDVKEPEVKEPDVKEPKASTFC